MVGYKPNGQPDRRYVYDKTRAIVQRKLGELQHQAASETLGDSQAAQQTVAGFLLRWLAAQHHLWQPRTYERYCERVTLHLVPGIGRHKLTALRPIHLQHIYAAKLDEGLVPKTVKNVHAVLRGVLNRAVKWQDVPCNVAGRRSGERAGLPTSHPHRRRDSAAA